MAGPHPLVLRRRGGSRSSPRCAFTQGVPRRRLGSDRRCPLGSDDACDQGQPPAAGLPGEGPDLSAGRLGRRCARRILRSWRATRSHHRACRGSLAFQTIWVAGITYLVWFWLLSHYPASPLQAGTSMTPLFGIVGAFLLLGEPISLSFG